MQALCVQWIYSIVPCSTFLRILLHCGPSHCLWHRHRWNKSSLLRSNPSFRSRWAAEESRFQKKMNWLILMGWFKATLSTGPCLVGPDRYLDGPEAWKGLQDQLSIAPFTVYNACFSLPFPQYLLQHNYLRSVEEHHVRLAIGKNWSSKSGLFSVIRSWPCSCTIDLLKVAVGNGDLEAVQWLITYLKARNVVAAASASTGENDLPLCSLIQDCLDTWFADNNPKLYHSMRFQNGLMYTNSDSKRYLFRDMAHLLCE